MGNSQAVWSLQPAVAGVLGAVSNDRVVGEKEKIVKMNINKKVKGHEIRSLVHSPLSHAKKLQPFVSWHLFWHCLGDLRGRGRNISGLIVRFVSVTLFSVQVTGHHSYLPPGCPCTPLGKWILGKTVDFAQTTDRWDPHWCLEKNRSHITSLPQPIYVVIIISSLYFSLWFVNANVTWVEDNVCILTIL